MKKLITTSVALATFASVAAAQSSVTIFGTMDVAMRRLDNGTAGSTSVMTSGGRASSRWGVRGIEDLGGGLGAGFWLESDVAADSGASNATTYWSRRSTLSLISRDLGEIRLGRDMVPTHVASCALDPFTCVGLVSAVGYRSTQAALFAGIGSFQLAFRANNAINYFTPATLGGFQAQLTYSAGEGQVSAGTEQSDGRGVRLSYRRGPVNLQAATWRVRNTTAAVPGFTDNVIGAGYDFGVVTLALQRRSFAWSSEKLNMTMVHISAPLGPGLIKLNYIKADQISANAVTNANDSSMVGLGYDYFLSKRTSLYATAGRVFNRNKAAFTLPGGPAVKAAAFGGQDSTGYEAGIRHDF